MDVPFPWDMFFLASPISSSCCIAFMSPNTKKALKCDEINQTCLLQTSSRIKMQLSCINANLFPHQMEVNIARSQIKHHFFFFIFPLDSYTTNISYDLWGFQDNKAVRYICVIPFVFTARQIVLFWNTKADWSCTVGYKIAMQQAGFVYSQIPP